MLRQIVDCPPSFVSVPPSSSLSHFLAVLFLFLPLFLRAFHNKPVGRLTSNEVRAFLLLFFFICVCHAGGATPRKIEASVGGAGGGWGWGVGGGVEGDAAGVHFFIQTMTGVGVGATFAPDEAQPVDGCATAKRPPPTPPPSRPITEWPRKNSVPNKKNSVSSFAEVNRVAVLENGSTRETCSVLWMIFRRSGKKMNNKLIFRFSDTVSTKILVSILFQNKLTMEY